MIRYTTQFRGKSFCIRDLEERDVDALVLYWHQSSPEFLRSLGVDLSKLKTPEETRRRFLESLPTAGPARSRATFVVTTDCELIAYTNVNIRSNDEAYGHFHVLQKGLSAKALSYVLFPAALQVFFAALPLSRVLFQTSPENENINRMLKTFGLQAHRMMLETPDGMARPGAFNVYEVTRGQAVEISRSAPRKRQHGSRQACG